MAISAELLEEIKGAPKTSVSAREDCGSELINTRKAVMNAIRRYLFLLIEEEKWCEMMLNGVKSQIDEE